MPPFYSDAVDLATLNPGMLADQLRARVTRAERQMAAIPAEVAMQPHAPGKWSVQQTVGHLIDSCVNNQQRLIRLQLTPELVFPGYAQEDWVRLQRYDLVPWGDVVVLWATLNRHFAHTIEHADAGCFGHGWAFEGERLTLGFILVDYMGHLEHHLRQLPNYADAA